MSLPPTRQRCGLPYQYNLLLGSAETMEKSYTWRAGISPTHPIPPFSCLLYIHVIIQTLLCISECDVVVSFVSGLMPQWCVLSFAALAPGAPLVLCVSVCCKSFLINGSGSTTVVLVWNFGACLASRDSCHEWGVQLILCCRPRFGAPAPGHQSMCGSVLATVCTLPMGCVLVKTCIFVCLTYILWCHGSYEHCC
jgi:hypothetical protein